MSETKLPFAVVVPWHNQGQIETFLASWRVTSIPAARPEWLILQQDKTGEGCAATKNIGVRRAAYIADVVIVLDDDCFPHRPSEQRGELPRSSPTTLLELAAAHLAALEPQDVEVFTAVTKPISRGTPYHARTVKLPVAASMGFWSQVGDYDAPGQLVHGAEHPMTFTRATVFGRMFPLCGMNLAFRPADWLPWCEFIDVPRFDDIWMGWLWQKEAYRRGHCFNLAGPLVRHSRQSNVWRNLQLEAVHLERNETLWRDIWQSEKQDYFALRGLLPV